MEQPRNMEQSSFRVMMLGGRKTGKTTFLNRITEGIFYEHYHMTETISKYNVVVNTMNKQITLTMIDGGSRFIPYIGNYNMDIVMLWISYEKLSTVDDAYIWCKFLTNEMPQVNIILCASHAKKSISEDYKHKLDNLIAKYNLNNCIEVDSKKGNNLHQPCLIAAELMCLNKSQNMRRGPFDTPNRIQTQKQFFIGGSNFVKG
jgi:hypothetical protein